MNFEQANINLKNGFIVRRESWPKEKKGIFMQIPSIVPANVVPKMTSLSPQVKEYFQATFDDPNEQIDTIIYVDQIALIGLSNVITGFQFSTSDVFSEDWKLVEPISGKSKLAGTEPAPVAGTSEEPYAENSALIFDQIIAERKRQFAKWGAQSHKPIEWVAILTEEVGETSKEALDHHFKNDDGGSLERYRNELIQTTAVAFQMLQDLYKHCPELKP